jgi:hypothetical protein
MLVENLRHLSASGALALLYSLDIKIRKHFPKCTDFVTHIIRFLCMLVPDLDMSIFDVFYTKSFKISMTYTWIRKLYCPSSSTHSAQLFLQSSIILRRRHRLMKTSKGDRT